ncbi:MAG: trypsin-like peptidase domain-containing protein [Clostridia bacterium]|nr:trypsin-like peptidase domain-containing protein [Clostridia bacterium]
MDNNFKNVFDENYERKSSYGFKNKVVVPFVSGVLGCSLVIGTCFGVPQIKSKILGTTSTPTSSSASSLSDTHAGTVDFVSLASYSDTAVYAANKILPSIVGIEVTYNVTQHSIFDFFGDSSQTTSEATASGSGIIISEDGYILTNNHVVGSKSTSQFYNISEATSVKVTLSSGDNKTYDAKIIGKDSKTDLAVLKIEATGLTKAEFANSDSVKIGEFTMAVGNPLALGTTITCGVVSAVNREVDDGEKNKFKCIQTDAAINSGNSGGALVNSKGQVIGVNTLKVSSTGVEGIGFAIPINSTLNVIEELKTYSKVRRPYIGIDGRNLTEDIAKTHNLVVGVYVSTVDQFSAAEKAGIKIGDVITAIDGTEIKTKDELNEIKNKHKIGDTITLKIFRDGKSLEVQLKLGESN